MCWETEYISYIYVCMYRFWVCCWEKQSTTCMCLRNRAFIYVCMYVQGCMCILCMWETERGKRKGKVKGLAWSTMLSYTNNNTIIIIIIMYQFVFFFSMCMVSLSIIFWCTFSQYHLPFLLQTNKKQNKTKSHKWTKKQGTKKEKRKKFHLMYVSLDILLLLLAYTFERPLLFFMISFYQSLELCICHIFAFAFSLSSKAYRLWPTPKELYATITTEMKSIISPLWRLYRY